MSGKHRPGMRTWEDAPPYSIEGLFARRRIRSSVLTISSEASALHRSIRAIGYLADGYGTPACYRISMTPMQRALVRASFSAILPNIKQFAGQFDQQLSALRPGMGSNSSSEERARGRALVEMLLVCLSNLDTPTPEPPATDAVSADLEQSITTALLNTFEQHLGRGFTPEMRGAWMQLCLKVGNAMTEWA